MSIDVMRDGVITPEEITNVFAKYFSNADSLINKYEFGCLYHDDYRPGEITKLNKFNIHGSGILDFKTKRVEYNLDSTILWEAKCKCGGTGLVGFIIQYYTGVWEEIKQKLSKELFSEKNMTEELHLDNNGLRIRFVNFIEYRKKKSNLEDPTPYPTFSINCKFPPPFTDS